MLASIGRMSDGQLGSGCTKPLAGPEPAHWLQGHVGTLSLHPEAPWPMPGGCGDVPFPANLTTQRGPRAGAPSQCPHAKARTLLGPSTRGCLEEARGWPLFSRVTSVLVVEGQTGVCPVCAGNYNLASVLPSAPDMAQFKQGVRSVAGKLSVFANGVMTSIQVSETPCPRCALPPQSQGGGMWVVDLCVCCSVTQGLMDSRSLDSILA